VTHPMDPFSMKGVGWGYWKIDPNYQGNDWRENKHRISPSEIKNFEDVYVLTGCEPDTMFKPDQEPKDFKFFWFDNTMLPWLRYVSPSNKIGHKLWHRITYNRWNMNPNCPVDVSHRDRVNNRLNIESEGLINDISELWGETKSTKPLKKKKALIIPSSAKNHKNFFNETPEEWVNKIRNELDRQGFDYIVRHKIDMSNRHRNQISDQYVRESCDLLIGQYTAATSEVVVLGAPVITTSEHNPAREISTTWEEFCEGEIKHFTEKEVDDWITKMCAYTYYRDEFNTLKFIDVHPDGDYIRKKRSL